MSTAPAHTLVVIPCAAAKAATATVAAELYTSANFAYTLAAAKLEAADTERVCGVTTKVMILSAEHGLVELTDVLEPYNTKMGDAGTVAPMMLRFQLAELDPAAIISMLPSAYAAALKDAVDTGNDRGTTDIDLMDAYEAAPGIGFQRGVAGSLTRHHGELASA